MKEGLWVETGRKHNILNCTTIIVSVHFMKMSAEIEVIHFYALYIVRCLVHAMHCSIILDIACLWLRPILASVFVCKLTKVLC